MIPLMKSAFLYEYETKQALADFIVKTSKLSMGEKCLEFERSFAKFQNRRDAVLFNSGGSANLAMMQALRNLGRLSGGAKVGFSALTWSTNVMPIIQMGMTPVAIDCDPRNLNVMSHNLEKSLKQDSLDCLFVTNVMGFAGDLPKIKEICRQNNIVLIEDNCEALGSKVSDTLTGNFGEMSSFSFFVAHHMSTIEGGMVVTDDEELSQMLRIVRANGWDRNLNSKELYELRKKNNVSGEFDAKYTFYDLGFNLRPTEITGFLGCCQLQYLEKNINVRENNYLTLSAISQDNDDICNIEHLHMSVVSNFSFPVVCKTPSLREKYISQFSGAGVEIRPVISGNTQRQPFYKKYVSSLQDLPGADRIHDCGFYFGNYPELTQTDIEILSNCLRKY